MNNIAFNQIKISGILPQAYPFIMIDKVIDFEQDKHLTAVKNITGNEWVFEGKPFKTDVFPETLLIEAASQTALAFYGLNNKDEGKKMASRVRLGGIRSEFFKSVHIGDQLQISTGEFKVMKDKGFINIDIVREDEDIAKVKVFYGTAE